MKSVLHAEVLAALRCVASVPCVRLESRGNRRLHILVLWTLEAGGEVVLKQHNLLEEACSLDLASATRLVVTLSIKVSLESEASACQPL